MSVNSCEILFFSSDEKQANEVYMLEKILILSSLPASK